MWHTRSRGEIATAYEESALWESCWKFRMIARKLEAKLDDLPRYALEALAAEAYRSGVLTAFEVQQMLGLPSRWDTDDLLKRKAAYLDYSDDDLRQDIEALRKHLAT